MRKQHGPVPWVTFDMDNTLIKNPYWHLFFRPWLESEALKHHMDYRALWQQFHTEGERRWRQGRWVASFDWADIARALDLSPLPDPPQPSAASLHPLLLPGVEEMLKTLRRMNIRLGLVTNGFNRFQLPYLKSLGWDYCFDAIITPDRVGAAKPDPAVMAPVSPGLAHIGDRRMHDVLAAQRSDRVAILLGNPPVETDRIDPLSPSDVVPDYYLLDYRRLPGIIRGLLAQYV